MTIPNIGTMVDADIESPRAPVLAVLCLTPDSLRTLDPLFTALEAQTIAARLELVVLAPAACRDEALPFDERHFARVQRVDTTPGTTNPAMRARGVQYATAPYVVFTEDHCFPEPEWAAALVAALDTGAMGAGPMMVNANPDDPTSCVNFLLEYGPWSHPSAAGAQRHLPGHNSAYRRDALLAHGERLADVLRLESPWLWEATANGARLVCVPEARAHHFNFSVVLPALPLRFHGGRVFGATRSANWGAAKRALYAGALPLIIALRWWRVVRQATRDMPGRVSLAMHLRFPVLLAADSCGEAYGYLAGVGDAMHRISGLEFHRGRFTRGVPVVPRITAAVTAT